MYHTPEERRRLAGFRPDLDKTREEREERMKEIQKQKENHSKRSKARQIDNIRKSFHIRRKLNAAREFHSRKLVRECETEIESRLRERGVEVKDKYFWQSQKAPNKPMMSVARIHPERLHYVLSDKILLADFQADTPI